MQEILQSIDLSEILTLLWTAVLAPILTLIGNGIYNYLKSLQLDEYGCILYTEVANAVKCVYETEVKDIKGSADWTREKQRAVKELAKAKALQALTSAAYRCLKTANGDFDEWLDSMVGTALYDMKHGPEEAVSTMKGSQPEPKSDADLQA